MDNKFFFGSIILALCKGLLSVEKNESREIGNPKKIIIIRQHNQMGDLLAGVPLFRATKETYPQSFITLVVSPINSPGMVKNKFLDRVYVFNQKKLINPFYLVKTWRLLREDYDLAIAPVVVSISFTTNLLARISKSRIRIGANSLDGEPSTSKFFFDRRVDLDWRKHPDYNIVERTLDLVRPFGINTQNFRSEISYDETDTEFAENFINEFSDTGKKYLIGLHVGAAKPINCWALDRFAVLIKKIEKEYSANFYLTGGWAEREAISYLNKKLEMKFGRFIDRPIPQVAALISKSDLFISNDTGIMHVAGTTETPQISIFGPTNPFLWAPFGPNKYFIRKSELIDDVTVDDVFHLCTNILNNRENEK